MENAPTPVDIQLHRKSRILSVSFSDGEEFQLPCEYLRVYSPAAEVKIKAIPENGKEQVNIDAIEHQGNYAVQITFDDGHDTGIYSWETLYDLGKNQQSYWQQYLDKLAAHGIRRDQDGDRSGDSETEITLLYFAYLASKMRRESDRLTLPASVTDVDSLLKLLQKRSYENGHLFAPDNVRVTVNKQFAESFTRLDNGDEVGIVPVTPTAPPPPKR